MKHVFHFTIFTRIFLIIAIIGSLFGFMPASPARAAGVRYAKPTATGTGDCSSWANACTLQTALTGAVSGDEIWVMAGRHTPGSTRMDTFRLKSGVALYAGFSGTETIRDQRDWETQLTVLSGDIDGDDSQSPVIYDLVTVTGNTNNSYHVVAGGGADGSAILDGFTISGGYAQGTAFPAYLGGGIYNYRGNTLLRNVIIRGNSANYGGGMYIYDSSPQLMYVTFMDNSADQGGGIYSIDSDSSLINVTFTLNKGSGMYNMYGNPSLTNVAFENNRASSGGGMYNLNGNPSLTMVTFYRNFAIEGGGMYNKNSSNTRLKGVTFQYNDANYGGGMRLYNSSPTLTNVTFDLNRAAYGGGMDNNNGSNPNLTNVTFSRNSAYFGSGIRNSDSNPIIFNTIFWDKISISGEEIYDEGTSTPNVNDSVVQYGYSGGTNIITADPMLGWLDDFGGAGKQVIFLQAGSSAIDTGDDIRCPTTDQRGVTRPQRDHCDIGAYEYDHKGIYYTKPASTGKKNCTSWINACTLRAALKTVIGGDEIWVRAGVHTPGTTPADTFQLVNGVGIYGGFAGTETDRAERDPEANLTVLSGDIDWDDSQTPVITDPTTVTGNRNNSYNVVTGSGTDASAILDGFTISGGYASGDRKGGGMYNVFGSPSLENVTFSGNFAFFAGGMFNYGGSNPSLTNVTFNGNSASYGGGMGNSGSSPILTNATFFNNISTNLGGGMSNYNGSPILTNVSFVSNTAWGGGGGMYNSGSSPILTNATFFDNNSTNLGGGLYNFYASPTLTNVTFSNNTASNNGGGIYNSTSSPTIRNTLLWGNSATAGAQIHDEGTSAPVVSYSIVQEGYAGGTNIITADPLLSTLTDYGGSGKQVLPLQTGSSAIDTGDDANCPDADQRGMTRPQGAHCDIGAYEAPDTTEPSILSITRADPNPTPAFNVDFRVTFSEPVTGVDTSDFSLTTTGVTGASVTSATDTGDQTSYTVMVDTGSGDGTIRLDLKASGTGIADLASHPISGGYTSGEEYQIQRDLINIYYTKPAATGSGDCTSWGDSCTLQEALTAVPPGGVEIWAMAGVHTPGSTRTDSFQLLSGVEIYGGFAGTETARDQRDPDTNQTILSGDIDGDDSQTPVITDLTTVTGNTNNSYHVVTGSGTDATAILDGFTISAGYADGTGFPAYVGGGMYNDSGSPSLTEVGFIGNSAGYGGGIYNYSNSSPSLINVTFNGNSASSDGGGLSNDSSNPNLENVTFSGNFASSGGGMFNQNTSSPSLANVTFSSNAATTYGGGMFNLLSSSPSLANVTFNGNSASYGGGMYNQSNSNAAIRNTILWGNSASFSGAEIYNYSTSTPVISNSVVQGSNGSDASWDTNLGTDGGGNLDDDPLLDALTDFGGPGKQVVPLQTGSSAIDTGDDANCPTTDQRDVARPQGAHCDIGAYEALDTTSPTVSSITRAGASPTNASSVDFTVTFSEPVTGVDTGDFYLTTTGVTGASVTSVTDTGDQINYTVTVDTGSGDGTLRLDLKISTTGIQDLAGNPIIGGYIGGEEYQIQRDLISLYHTKPAATGSGDCTTWADACPLQKALKVASSGEEIWVMAGVHTPGTTRTDTFQLVSGVEVYGGFAGTETTREQRDSDTNLTVLSGDIDGDDSQTPIITDLSTVTGNTNNSYHVVTADHIDSATILDGFTISAGYADGTTPDNNGGGMYIVNAGSLSLINITFWANYASVGGGLHAINSSFTLTNATFNTNSADVIGGGMHLYNSDPTLTIVTFNANSAGYYGGGLCNNAYSDPILTNVTFYNNEATQNGGGLYNFNANPTLTNVTFSSNTVSNHGGGIYNSTSSPTIRNTLLWGNSATAGAQIHDEGTSAPVVSYSVVQDGYAGGTNIITTNPLLSTLTDFGGAGRQVLPLQVGSSAIDTGEDGNCPATDQRSMARPQIAHCDIGAYEYEPDTTPPTVDSITRANPNPTSAPSIAFIVTFSEPVTGVDAVDFTITKTGSITGYAITNVSPSAGPASVYTVTVSTGEYNGTLRLDVNGSGTGIQDEAGNDLSDGFTSGEAYTVNKIYALTVKSIGNQDGWVLESTETSGVGGTKNNRSKNLYVGDDVLNRQYRDILSFNTKALPDNAVITKVILKVKKAGVIGTNPMSTHDSLAVDIKKPKFGTKPALQPGDFQANANKLKAGKFSKKLYSGWYKSVLYKGAYPYINLKGRTQFRLRFLLDDNDDNSADILKLYSGNAIKVNGPRLIVKYYVP